MQTEIFLIFLLPIIILGKSDDYSVIDLSDILNVDYMPGSLLVLENPQEYGTENISETDYDAQHQGTIKDALATMNFHRKMMNEYLCRSYVSEQIITEMRSSRIRRRLGKPIEHRNSLSGYSPANISIKNNLLDDEGSSNYQEWLKKSATLEDIYRHYDAQSKGGPDHNREATYEHDEFDGHVTGYAYQQPHNIGSPSKFGHSGSGGGYPSNGYGGGHGHATGIGTGGGLLGYQPGGHSGYGGGSFLAPSEHIFGEGTSGHSGHGYTAIHEYPKHHGGGHDKEKLADLFDIALTALAYLSFGMFIVQVIMCISMGTTTTAPAMTMMPMSLGADTIGGMNRGDVMGGGEVIGGGAGNKNTHYGAEAVDDINYNEEANNDEEDQENINSNDDVIHDQDDFGDGYVRIGKGFAESAEAEDNGSTGDGDVREGSRIRVRRDIPIIAQPNNELLNDLSRRILISIEAALVAYQDDGNCLRRALCENNVYSRTLDSNQKYWIPVWSLGMSWLSGRLIPGLPSTTSMLDSLKASILGLGKADCELIYSQCDLGKERQKRRRRRKRSI